MQVRQLSNLNKKSVQKVISILEKIGHPNPVIELKETARSAAEAATSLNVQVGAIVKTLLFLIENKNGRIPIIVLVAGDNKCNTEVLPKIINLEGRVIRPNAESVKKITGYSIGGVSPVGLPREIKIIIDTSLKRFENVWSAAGHPYCVFSSTFSELLKITKAVQSENIIKKN